MVVWCMYGACMVHIQGLRTISQRCTVHVWCISYKLEQFLSVVRCIHDQDYIQRRTTTKSFSNRLLIQQESSINDRTVLNKSYAIVCLKRSILSYNNGIRSILYSVLFYCYGYCIVVVAADDNVVLLLLLLLYCKRSPRIVMVVVVALSRRRRCLGCVRIVALLHHRHHRHPCIVVAATIT